MTRYLLALSQKDQLLKCECGWETAIDPFCELPPEAYNCDECGKSLAEVAKGLK